MKNENKWMKCAESAMRFLLKRLVLTDSGKMLFRVEWTAGCSKPPTKIILGTVHQIFAILFIFTVK